MTFPIELTSPDDPYRDFCLWPYEAPAKAAPLSHQGVNLLYHAAEHAGCLASYQSLIAALRQGIGPFETVWGIKWNGTNLSTELYFYDYERLARRVSLPLIKNALEKTIRIDPDLSDNIPYFMLSLEVPMSPDGLPSSINEIDVYVGHPGSNVSSGICYARTPDDFEMKNFYFFFDRHKEWNDIVGKIESAAFYPDQGVPLDEVLPPFLRDCQVIVVANKRRADGLYASHISACTLLAFLKWQDYPQAIIDNLETNLPHYTHLLFDVGFDYKVTDGKLEILKSSFYNVF